MSRKKPKARFIVTKTADDGVPHDTRLAPPRELGLGPQLSGKRGLLIVAGRSEPTVFPGEKSARRAIDKTIKARRFLNGTMVDGLPRLRPLLANGTFGTRVFFQ